MANKRSPKKTARTKAVLRLPDLDQAKSAVFEQPEFARRSTQIGGPRICLMIGMRMTGNTEVDSRKIASV